MTGPRRFDPAEVSGPGSAAGDTEVAEALLVAQALEASIPARDPVVSADLGERIMVAVRREPPPRVLSILETLRRRPSPAGLLESLQLAWARAATVGSLAVRAGAFAYVALVLVIGISVSGVAAYTAAGALGLFTMPSRGPDSTQLVTSPRPSQSLAPSDIESPEPSESAEPAETSEPTESAGDEHQDGSGSGVGASATPGDGEDSGGDSSSGSVPAPTRTPRPSDTPKPSSD